MKLFGILTMLFFASSLYGDVSDKSTGQSFPSQVSFDYEGKNYKLDATGVATRKKFMVKIYSVAHYMQAGTKSADILKEIMQDDKAKQLTMKYVYEATATQAKEGTQEAFKNALSAADYTKLQKEIDTYSSFFNKNIKKGDEIVVRWIPGGVIEASFNGAKLGTIKSKDFAVALWSIWFGSKSVVNRDELISLVK